MGPTIRINDLPAMPGSISTSSTAQLVRSTASVLDPAWRHVDSAGHFHAVSTDRSDRLPTLRSEPRGVPCDGSCGGACEDEGYTVVDHFCRLCGEPITPGAIPGPHMVEASRTYEWSGELRTTGAEWFALVGKSVTVRQDCLDGSTGFGIAIVTGYDSDGPVVTFEGSGSLATTEPSGYRNGFVMS